MRGRISSVVIVCGLLAAPAWRAGAQGADVRIDVRSGAVARLPLQCEALQGSGATPAPSRDADQVLANDLQSSAVFAVNRLWAPDAARGHWIRVRHRQRGAHHHESARRG